MPESIRTSIEVAADCATVFRALTQATALQAWFAEYAEVDLATGRYDFWGRHTPGNPTAEEGRHQIVRIDQDRELTFEWRVGGQGFVVVISLAPISGRTLVTVNQRVEGDLKDGSANHADVWCLALQNLRAWVETGSAAWLPDFSGPTTGEVRLEVDAIAPPTTVFAGLIQPELLNRWMAVDATVEPRVGGTYDMGWGEDGGRPVKILDLVPDSRLAVSWADPGEPDTVVTWELEGSAGATRITLVHSGFGDDRPHDDYYAGWVDFLVRLKCISEGGPSWVGPRYPA